jgi:tetratricopeptide (TPR) repeat protein
MARQRPPDYLPSDVLARADFAHACGARDLGGMLGIAIKWGGPGFTASHVARRCEMTISQVQDYVRRGRQALSIEIFDRVADGLHIPGHMLRISDRPWENPSTAPLPHRDSPFSAYWTADSTLALVNELLEVNPVDRRLFLLLTGTALTAPAHDWLIAHPVSDVSSSADRTVEPGLVDQLDETTSRLRRMDDELGGGSLVDLVRAQTAYAVRLLRNGRYTDSTGRRLYGTVSELLRLGGWVSYDSGNAAQAQRYWITALKSAHTAGDSALAANILGFMSEPARDMGRPDDAVKLTATALAGYKGGSPRLSMTLHMRSAMAHAAQGDAAESKRAIDSAYAAFQKSPPESGEPAWSYWMDEGMLHEQIGTSFMSLKDYPAACQHLEISLQCDQNSQVREGALRLTRLATAYVRQREPEQASTIGIRAIDTLASKVDSPRITADIERLRSEMRPYAHMSAVQEFSSKVDALSEP